MSLAASRGTKGVDADAREIATDLARRSGMTLAAWLNQIIIDDGAESRRSSHRYAASHVPPVSLNTERLAPRLHAPSHAADQIAGVVEALDRLAGRVEASDRRTTAALGGLEQSVAGLASRVESGEREQIMSAARFEGAVDELRLEQSRVAERLYRVEEHGGAAETFAAMETAVAALLAKFSDGETRSGVAFLGLRDELDSIHQRLNADSGAATVFESAVDRLAARVGLAEVFNAEALRGLQTSLNDVGERLQTAEERLIKPVANVDLKQLEVDFSARIKAAGAAAGAQVRTEVDAGFERMNAALQDIAGRIAASEQRAQHAVERIGQELVRTGATLSEKVDGVDQRSIEASNRLGGEVARIGDSMEAAFARADAAGVQAAERLSAKVAQITKGMSRRIVKAEQRSAMAIEDIGERVNCACEWLDETQEKAFDELTARLARNDDRVAKLLADFRTEIEPPQAAEITNEVVADAAPVAEAADDYDPFPRLMPAEIEPAAMAETDVDEHVDLFGPPAPAEPQHASYAFRPQPLARDSDDPDDLGEPDDLADWAIVALERIEHAQDQKAVGEGAPSRSGRAWDSTFAWLMGFGGKKS